MFVAAAVTNLSCYVYPIYFTHCSVQWHTCLYTPSQPCHNTRDGRLITIGSMGDFPGIALTFPYDIVCWMQMGYGNLDLSDLSKEKTNIWLQCLIIYSLDIKYTLCTKIQNP